MQRNLSHIAKVVGTLTFLMVAFAFAPAGNAETRAGGKNESKRPVLSIAAIDAMREAVTDRFILPGNLKDAASVQLRVHVRLDQNGRVARAPEVDVSGGSEHTRDIMTKAALRAVIGAAPYVMLPKDKYDAWKEVILNFDTSAFTQ
ncbi:hypothetical protein PYR71_18605 [Rhizobium sp. MC63]|uniref:Uncharacterized protein n=1 Tax=Rhizobium mulingense TaxID=3031128 RepID=A0ACC6MZ94_9HYPH|nr:MULTISPECIES: hypothetical protein [unclassified Rhizobium]MDF0698481.1 hypothetical protein [Rhizobium sp. MC63]MEA3518669.1 hypothetical protein [Rhizobium sp. MJ31]